MKTSACMIVKNESKNIEKCINSFKDIVNEIIVVDTGSTDNTVELAKNLGAKVLFMQWQNDFAAPKNYAIENATGDWIIFLDADEYFEEGSSKKIIHALNILNDQSVYDSMGCKMYHLDSENGAVKGQNVVIRAFKRKNSIRYKNSIHENLLDGNKNLNSLYFNDIIVYHTGYANSKITSKYRRNIELLESVVSKGEADTMTYYYLCSSYNGLNEFEKSIFYAGKTFEEEGRSGFRVPEIYRYKVYTSKIQSMGLLGNRYSNYQIGEAVSQAIAEYADHPEVLWIKAQYLTRIKKFRDALDCYIMAVESNKKDTYEMCNYFESYIDQVYSNIGTIYVYMNLEEPALNYFILSLEKNKFNKDAAIRYLRLVRSYKDEYIISILNKLYNTNEFIELQFLIECLCETRLPIPLIYYTKKWNSTFEQQDISVILSMFAMGKYDDAIELGIITSKSDDLKTGLDLAVLAIFLTDSLSKYKSKLEEVSKEAYRLLELMRDPVTKFILEDYYTDLIKAILKLAIPFCKNDVVISLLEFILGHCSDKTAYVLFDQLLFFNKFELAAEFYIKLFDKTANAEIKTNCSFIAGFSSYRNHGFNKALELFKTSIKYGYYDTELMECLEIMLEQCKDNGFLDSVNEVINVFSSARAYVESTVGIDKLPAERYKASSFLFEDAPLVSIVVLAYNKVEFTKQCIESIYKYTEGIDYELVVVNNGSSDGTHVYFESLPKKRVVYIEKNQGPCYGFNEGIKAAKGRYVACVCNDFIFTKNWLSNLITCIQSDERIGYVSPGSSYISNFQQINCNYSTQEEMQKFAEEYNVSDPRKWEERIRLLPNVLFVKREIFDIVGYFDPVFIYGDFADDDLAFRIRRAGYKLVYAGDTFTHHFGHVTVGKVQRENKSLEVGREIFISKYGVDSWNDVQYDMNLINTIEYGNMAGSSNITILGIDPLCGATLLQIKNRFNSDCNAKIKLSASTSNPKYYPDLITICNKVICGNIDTVKRDFTGHKFDYIVFNTPVNDYSNYCFILESMESLLNEGGHIMLSFKNRINLLTDHLKFDQSTITSFVNEFHEFNSRLSKGNLKISKCINENLNLTDEQNKEIFESCKAINGIDTNQVGNILRLNRYIIDIVKL